ncbi:MAG: hypothetical protein GY877_03245, partial [Hyphomicrobium sp.]|nr:hypothetical protein [Hyphomicrobium sp.]
MVLVVCAAFAFNAWGSDAAMAVKGVKIENTLNGPGGFVDYDIYRQDAVGTYTFQKSCRLGDDESCTFDYGDLSPLASLRVYWRLSSNQSIDLDSSTCTGSPSYFTDTFAYVYAFFNVVQTCKITITYTPQSLQLTGETAFQDPPQVGDRIEYSYRVYNRTTSYTLENITVSDSLGNAITCPQSGTNVIPSLAPLRAAICTATYRITQKDIDAGKVANTATAKPEEGGEAIAEAETDIKQVPDLEIAMNVEPEIFRAAGDSLEFTYKVTNTGNVTLENVEIFEDLLPNSTCSAESLSPLKPGEEKSCSATYSVTQADFDDGEVIAKGRARGYDLNDGEAISNEAFAIAHLDTIKLELVVTGEPKFQSPPQVGDAIDNEYIVINESHTETLTNITVSGSNVDTITCLGNNPITSLEPDASQTCKGTYHITQEDIDNGFASTKGFAKADQEGAEAENDDSTTIDQVSNLTLALSVVPETYVRVGEELTYTYEVTNNGNVTLGGVKITQGLLPNNDCSPTALSPGEPKSCIARYLVTEADIETGSIENTAKAQGDDPKGNSVPSNVASA